jgi:hypothetical protein
MRTPNPVRIYKSINDKNRPDRAGQRLFSLLLKEAHMPYVYWHEKPERTTSIATVSKPPDDPKALAKQFAGKSTENEYTPDEHMTNIRLAGAKREHRLI